MLPGGAVMQQEKKTKGKKSYRTPVVQEFGTIRAITQANANMSAANDGGSGNSKKTA